MKYLVCILLLLLFVLCPLYSQSGESAGIFSTQIMPSGLMPLGSSRELFDFGGGVDAALSYFPAKLKTIGLSVGGRFGVLPIKTSDSVNLLSGYGGPVVRIPLNESVVLQGHGGVGYYMWNAMGWNAGNSTGGSLMMIGGLTSLMKLDERFSFGAGVSYDYFTDLYNGLSINLLLSAGFPVQKRDKPVRTLEEKIEPDLMIENGEGLQLDNVVLNPIYPVLYKYYDAMPIGTVELSNSGEDAAENITIRFFVERYMDNPMTMEESFSLEPGEGRTVDLFGLFTEDLMEITEGTKASANITVSYTTAGEKSRTEITPVLEFHNRNALSWDDDRKIASFITAKDPEVLIFSKNVLSWIKDIKNSAVDDNFQKGMVLFEAVKAYGIIYAIDPTTPFSEYSGNTESVDFLQFPRQTLQYSSGDCDDLSALYTALLEAVGVETAVITIPGHIFTAFALESTPREARKSFSQADNLIFHDEKAWIPIEITMFQDSFEDAWNTGAKEWREHSARDQSRIFPTRDAWQIYQPVGFKEGSSFIELPDRRAVESAFAYSLQRHVEREIYPQAAQIQQRIAKSDYPYKHENSLAVLYARYGMYDRALGIFDAIIEKHDYRPAMINAGNIHFISKNYMAALKYYDQVLDLEPANASALLASARCNHELENYGLVKSNYAMLKSLEPETAMRFAYLDLRGDESQRAADASGLRDVVLWEEEE